MSAVFRGNFHFVPSRRLASCFGFAHPVPCKIPRSRTPRSLGGQQGLAQATRETSAGLVLTPVTGASLQIFTFMTWKTPWKFKKKKKPTPKTLAKHFVPSCCWNLLRSQARRGRAAALAVDYPFPLNFSLHFLSPPSWEEQLRLWSLCCSWSTAGKCRKSVTLEICLLPERDSPGRERFRGSSALYPDKWGCGEGRSCLWIPIPPPRGREMLIIPEESSGVTLGVFAQALIWVSEPPFLSLSWQQPAHLAGISDIFYLPLFWALSWRIRVFYHRIWAVVCCYHAFCFLWKTISNVWLFTIKSISLIYQGVEDKLHYLHIRGACWGESIAVVRFHNINF